MKLLLLYTVSFVSAFEQYVRLRDITSDPGLPETVTMDIVRDGRTVTRLNLQENKHLNENANVFESGLDEVNRRQATGTETKLLTGIKYYHDKQNGAALSVTCEETPTRLCIRTVEGFLNIGNETFEVRPASTRMAKRKARNGGQNLHLISRVAHLKYFQDTSRETDKKYNKDYTETNKIELNGQTRRQSKTEYAVEIIVVIDPFLWKKYLDRTKAKNGMTKEQATEYRLRRKLAHIINGVSLRYESIEDPAFNVYVTISGFQFYKIKDDRSPVPKGKDAPTIKDGEPYVASGAYLDNLVTWQSSLSGVQHDDHIMVFTGCELYIDGNISDTTVSGMSLMGGACNDDRVSIQQEGDYFVTTSIAAHELGHNLNADHDGEGDSKNCQADNKFIMAPYVNQLFAEDKYTINPWRFSECSIASFKSYFQSENGTCLTDHGDYYDKSEWDKHNEKLPGELYNLDQQCKLINGDDSGICPDGIPVTDEKICQEIQCIFESGCSYHTPARGSPCGNPAGKKWCIDGKCVARIIKGTTAPPAKTKTPPKLPENPADNECFTTTSNMYMGTRSATKSGLTCERWVKTSYTDVETFPDNNIADAANYCRDPDDTGIPWCFVPDPDVVWEECDIHKCK